MGYGVWMARQAPCTARGTGMAVLRWCRKPRVWGMTKCWPAGLLGVWVTQPCSTPAGGQTLPAHPPAATRVILAAGSDARTRHDPSGAHRPGTLHHPAHPDQASPCLGRSPRRELPRSGDCPRAAFKGRPGLPSPLIAAERGVYQLTCLRGTHICYAPHARRPVAVVRHRRQREPRLQRTCARRICTGPRARRAYN